MYWKLYFAAYWGAFHLGEKEGPSINAWWYMTLIIGIYLFSIVFALDFLLEDIPFPNLLFSLSMILPATLNFILWNSRKREQIKVKYNYFALRENRFKCYWNLLGYFFAAVIFMLATIMINKINH